MSVTEFFDQMRSLKKKGEAMARPNNVVAIIKKGEAFIFLYDDVSDGTLIRQLNRLVADGELCFGKRERKIARRAVVRLRAERLSETDSPRWINRMKENTQ